VQRQDLPELISIINQFNPKAFYTVETVRYANQVVNYSPLASGGGLFSLFGNLKRR
jgi:hypothetical protein